MRRVRKQCGALAKHRSVSVARSTPTRALARDTPKKHKISHLGISIYQNFL
ncbi:MAG: hypothetical protein NZ455_12335 [Bacteroidia bacterium]|nr:hypothetical protein [Bacteroidia bacterium]MDW8348268.1 hypothetical protein [Bacteroidia bacterium]